MEARSQTRIQNRAWNAHKIRKQALNPFFVGLVIGTVYSILFNDLSFQMIVFKISIVLMTFAVISYVRKRANREINRLRYANNTELKKIKNI